VKKIIILVLMTVFVVPCLYADFSYEVGFVSSYVWRGWDLYPKNKPALQPSITYTFGKSGFSVNVWYSYILTDRGEVVDGIILKDLEEIDFTFNYDFSLSENVSLSIGMINYSFLWTPGYTFKDSNSQEFYATLGLPKLFLGPSLSVYYDINLGDGFYFELSGGHSFKLTDNAALELGATLGYNAGQYLSDDDDTGISDLTLSASLPFTIGKIGITPTVNYTHVFLEPLYREGDKKGKLWFAVNIAFN
jgi:uncharacterized protein (TIGR02001 family)